MRNEQNKTLEVRWYYKRKFSGPMKKILKTMQQCLGLTCMIS